jgi:hypothetical protein
MRHRSPTLFRWLTGHRDDLRYLLGGKLAGPPAPGRIAQQPFDGVRQSGAFLTTFNQDQALKGSHPPPPPHAYYVPFTLYYLGDGFIGLPRKRQDDHACTLRHTLPAGA